MAGLMWLAGAGSTAACMTFVRGADERTVLERLGVDPDAAISSDAPQFPTTPGISLVRSGDWVVALEDSVWARGKRPDVLGRVSAGTEAVVIYKDDGKGNHEFAHAVDGEIITAVTTSAPPHWRGTQPERLRPLLKVPDLPSDPAHRARPATPVAVDTGPVRAHLQDLLDKGIPADTIAARAEMTTIVLDSLLSGRTRLIATYDAQKILAIEAPPPSAP